MRQHYGPTGKTENCQASVMIGYSGKGGHGFIDRRIFVPEEWFDDDHKEKRESCEFPKGLKFKTKNEIAIKLLQSALNKRIFPAKWVGVDSAFGHDHKFLDAIPKSLYYFTDIHADDEFYVRMPYTYIPNWGGKGKESMRPKTDEKPFQVREIIEKSVAPWKNVEFGFGSKGSIMGEEKILRVVDIRNGVPNKWVWLYARKWPDGRIKYMLSNAPDDTKPNKLRKLSLRRWAIEQCFKECKSLLGMGHYEGRSWLGWHRHILFVFIAHLFLQIIRKD
jgi:SRSO17 transposase